MSEYIYKGKVPTAFIDEALEAYRLYKADRDPLIQRIRDNEAFYRRSYERLYDNIESKMECDTPFIFAFSPAICSASGDRSDAHTTLLGI